MRANLFFLCLCLGALMALLGPGRGFVLAEQASEPDQRQVLRLGVHVSSLGTLDPHLASGSQDRILADMLFNGLLRYKPGMAPSLEPDLARDFPQYEMVNGRQVWTVKLKKGVFFHPGDSLQAYELTAEDVVFSLRKAADPRHSRYAGEYSGMTFRKIDDYTLQITLSQPLSPTLFFPKIADYSGGFIISRRAVQAKGYEYVQSHPVGTGPFRFSRHIPGEKVVLTANDQYFRGKAKLKGVEVYFLPTYRERYAAIRSGRVDVTAATGDPESVERLVSESRFILDIHGVGELVTIHLNARKKPLGNIKVRKAILYALNRSRFLHSSHPRVVKEVLSPVPGDLLPGGLNNAEVRGLDLDYAYNLKKARELMAEAGYEHGFSVSVIASEKRLYRRLYKLLQQELRPINIHCSIDVVPHSVMHRLIREDQSDIVIYGAWRPTTDAYLTRFFHSDSIVVTGKNPDTNFSHYDKIDALIEDARLQISPEKQEQQWEHAQIRLLNDAVAYPLFLVNQFFLRSHAVDYGHPLTASFSLYPQITESTNFIR